MLKINTIEFASNVKDYYTIDKLGNITNQETGLNLKQQSTKDGYKIVTLKCIDVRKRTFRVNRLVAACFCEKPEGLSFEDLEANHKDFDRANNFHENLEWTTPKGNSEHTRKNGRGSVKVLSSEKMEEIVKYFNSNPSSSLSEAARHLGIENPKVIQYFLSEKNPSSLVLEFRSKIEKPPEQKKNRRSLEKEKVEEICILLKKGMGYKEVSSITGCSIDIISDIKKGRGYKEIVSSYLPFPVLKIRQSAAKLS